MPMCVRTHAHAHAIFIHPAKAPPPDLAATRPNAHAHAHTHTYLFKTISRPNYQNCHHTLTPRSMTAMWPNIHSKHTWLRVCMTVLLKLMPVILPNFDHVHHAHANFVSPTRNHTYIHAYIYIHIHTYIHTHTFTLTQILFLQPETTAIFGSIHRLCHMYAHHAVLIIRMCVCVCVCVCFKVCNAHMCIYVCHSAKFWS
jgi:hypothetical protein